MTFYERYDEVLAAEGASAAPASQAGKLRCPLCKEWVADNAEDRRAHARQERLRLPAPRRKQP